MNRAGVWESRMCWEWMCRLGWAHFKGKFPRFGDSRSEGSKRGSCSSTQMTGIICSPKTLTETIGAAHESVPEIKYLQWWGKLFPGCDEIKNSSFSVGLLILLSPGANLILAEFWTFPAFMVGFIQVTEVCAAGTVVVTSQQIGWGLTGWILSHGTWNHWWEQSWRD